MTQNCGVLGHALQKPFATEKYALIGSSRILIEQENFFTDVLLAWHWTGHHTLAPTLHFTILHCTAFQEPAQAGDLMLSTALPV